MSDDLVKRLRDLGDHASFEPHMHHTAADRIEELESKLAKAVEVLQWQADAIRESISARHVGPHRIFFNGVYYDGPLANFAYRTLTGFETISRTVLADIRGQGG